MVDPDFVVYTDEACFHLRGYVNSQNNRYWSAENPHSIHKVPLHDVKFEVWCAISAHRIHGPVFFQETINSERYVRVILNPFFRELTEEEKTYRNFYARQRNSVHRQSLNK
jgi:hypothetical protein